LTIFGDGKQTRDYVSVSDVARANLLAGTTGLPGDADHDARAFNIATSVERSVLDLAEAVGRVLGRRPELRFEPARPGEIQRSALEVRKAERLLGWRPLMAFDDNLARLMDWFRLEG
jgi:UDP-glucose 4-epimerase